MSCLGKRTQRYMAILGQRRILYVVTHDGWWSPSRGVISEVPSGGEPHDWTGFVRFFHTASRARRFLRAHPDMRCSRTILSGGGTVKPWPQRRSR